MREKFPSKTREGTTTHFVIHSIDEEDARKTDVPRMVEVDGYLTINVFQDGRPGEVFIRIGKAGSSLAWVDEWCIMFSLLLQEGWTVDELCPKFAYKSYLPSGGVTGVPGILKCSSLTDLICKIILKKFGTPMREEQS